MIPLGSPYWFESADYDEDLELLQAAAKLRGEKDICANHEERPVEMKNKSSALVRGRIGRCVPLNVLRDGHPHTPQTKAPDRFPCRGLLEI